MRKICPGIYLPPIRLTGNVTCLNSEMDLLRLTINLVLKIKNTSDFPSKVKDVCVKVF